MNSVTIGRRIHAILTRGVRPRDVGRLLALLRAFRHALKREAA